VGSAAGAARAHFYVIQPEAIMASTALNRPEGIAGSGFRGSDNPIEGLEHLAGVTGGPLIHLVSDEQAAGVRPRAARERVVLPRDDRPRALGPRPRAYPRHPVARAGARVHSRPEITFAEVDRISARAEQSSPRDMIKVSDVFRDLPLRATAYSRPPANPARSGVVTVAEAPTSGRS